MKKITILFYFILFTMFFCPLSYGQTLAGSTVAFVQIGGNATVVDGDPSVPGEFSVSPDISYDIDATQIIFSFRNSSSVNLALDFTFSGGTVTGITSIIVNPTQSSLDVSSVTSSVHSSGIGVTFNTGTATVSGTTYGQIVFDLVVEGISNTSPVIANTSAGQAVNDNSTLSPFSAITTTDADGDNLSATITLDDNAKGVLSGTDLTGTGPYSITSTTPADLQAKLRALSFNPTDNRASTSETTTFTVVVSDATSTDTNNITTVISSAVAPVVNEVNSFTTNGTYSSGSDIIISVTFSENVTVNGTPQITLETGIIDRTINYNGTGSGSNTLLFTYTVQTGDESADLDYVATNSLTAGTSIQDAGGSNATLTLAIPGTTGSLGANKALAIDTVAPVGYSVTIDQFPINTTNDDAVSFTFTGAEIGATYNYSFTSSGGAGSVTGSGVVATAIDKITGIDISGLEDSTITLSVTLTDLNGNTGTAATDNETKDAKTPAVAITSSEMSPTDSNVIPITITFDEEVQSFTDSDLTLTNGSIFMFSTTDDMVFTGMINPSMPGPITVNIDQGIATDLLGNENTSANEFSIFVNGDSISINTPIAGDNIVDATESSMLLISGTSQGLENAFGFTLEIGTVSASVNIGNNGTWSSLVDISSLPNGNYNVTIDGPDSFGSSVGDFAQITLNKQTLSNETFDIEKLISIGTIVDNELIINSTVYVISVKTYNLQGALVAENINLSELASGIYITIIETEKGIITKKIIKN